MKLLKDDIETNILIRIHKNSLVHMRGENKYWSILMLLIWAEVEHRLSVRFSYWGHRIGDWIGSVK